ncbi:MAG: RNA polymerase sigma factor [Cryomorphaceae bacterium]|jgi:RNA polymerase sigma factor (sigma-70 family)|nr:RNA polymerase sigma factor [Cryomorphaceae bacterium]
MTVTEYNSCVNELADGLFRFAIKTTGNSSAAEDFVQDAFERLWRKADQIEATKAKAYLFRTIINLQIDAVRRTKLSKIHLESQSVHEVQPPISFDLRKHLDDGLLRLTDAQRNALLLRDYEGYSYLEIADILNVSEDSVKVTIFRARKSLKEYLVTIDVLV